jgi:hypothetical protein
MIGRRRAFIYAIPAAIAVRESEVGVVPRNDEHKARPDRS